MHGSPQVFLHFECLHCKMHTSEHGGHKLEHGDLHLNTELISINDSNKKEDFVTHT